MAKVNECEGLATSWCKIGLAMENTTSCYAQNLPHQLKADTQMIPEVEIVQHMDDVVRSIGVFLTEFVKYANLNECLMMEAFLVADNFDCDILICFVVQSSDDLTKASFSNHFENLVAVTNVIVNHLRRVKVLIILSVNKKKHYCLYSKRTRAFCTTRKTWF